jgi:serine/threonine-protein kinase
MREVRPAIPEALEQVVAKGFAARVEDRFTSAAEYAQALAPLYDERVGTDLAIAAVVRGLFGAEAKKPAGSA